MTKRPILSRKPRAAVATAVAYYIEAVEIG